jgi:tRNA pseudouridine55 synthase
VVAVDKPAGPTSHDVVARVRRAMPRRTRVGHAGTLDPFATGLLTVLVGGATRLAPFLVDAEKEYEAVLRLGERSGTGDPEGPLSPGGEVPSRVALEAALAGMVGERLQRVPALSAVKVDGEPLYRRARRGEALDAPERPVRIHEIVLLESRLEDPAGAWGRIRVRCGKGTYIRQLAVDVGEALGCGAWCRELRRLRVGGVTLDGALAPGDVRPGDGLEPGAALGHMRARELTGAEVREVTHGRPVPPGPLDPGPDEAVRLMHRGRLVAVARPGCGGGLAPRVVLAP